MNRERVAALFAQAIEMPEASRADWLARHCDDETVRAEVERWLRADARAEGFLERPPALIADAAAAVEAAMDAAPEAFGVWRVVRSIGRGGMGEVWLAERGDGEFEQRVAIKQLAWPTPGLLQRFRQERRILARLEHPHIARLIDGGLDAKGVPYLVMEYVEGENLTAWVNAHAPTLAERLELFLQICDAVAYAHTRLIVHRDLKPANVLVSAAGQAMLLDFGIAKLLDADDTSERTRTLYLSPAYAAPEQLAGDAIGTATDVYALGVIGFELLTGQRPWPDEASPMTTALQRLQDRSPPAPSRVAGATATVPARALRGDLDAIFGKALRREPDRRYVDARALADDLRRHLAHLPVQARSGTRAYIARRFLRRHWLPLSTAALLFVALATATVAIAWQARRVHLAAQRAEAVQGFMIDLFTMNSAGQKDPVKAKQTTVRELLDIGAARIQDSLDLAPENKLALLRVFSDLYVDGLGEGYPSVPLQRQAVALSRSLYGENSVELAGDRIRLARPLIEQGNHAEAAQLLQAAAATLDRRGDRDSQWRGRLHLERAYDVLNRDDRQAWQEADAAIAVLRNFPPSKNLVLAHIIKSNAAQTVRGAQASLESVQEAIRVSRAIGGDRGPLLLVGYMNQARLQRTLWDIEAAEASARQALDLASRDPGEFAAYDRARALGALASIQLESGSIQPALASARQAKAWLDGPAGGANDPGVAGGVLRMLAATLGAAGELDDGLAQAVAAVTLLRGTSLDSHLAATLEIAADRFADLGRQAEAAAALDEARALRKRVDGSPDGGSAMRSIRAALDRGDTHGARTLLAGYASRVDAPREIEVSAFRRDLLEAEIELQDGNTSRSAELAGAVNARLRASELARYLRPLLADGERIEGLARVRGGDAAAAQPLLERALAARVDLYLPKSPKIAEAELALAECDLAQGRRDAAAQRVGRAVAIHAQHSALSPRYTAPLERLRAQLARR